MKTQQHPTKQKLIDAVLNLLENLQPYELSVEMVLEESGISSGSLYHHFEDFPNLIDHALVAKYAQYADVQIAGMEDALNKATSVKQYEKNLHALIERSHAANRKSLRILRAAIASQAASRPELRDLLAKEQNRLTEDLTNIIRSAQEKGWAQPNLDPMVISVFVQAYQLGRIVDDISDSPVDNANWIAFIKHMISRSALNL